MRAKPWPLDTSRDAFERRIEALRALSPGRRLAAGLELCDEVREGLLSTVSSRRPGCSADTLRREVVRLLLGDELYARACPEPGQHR